MEPYGFGPMNDLDAGGTCDIPMGEFWMNREITQVESAISAAHIYGKPVVSAESFTSRPEINWRGNPALAKIDGDKAWALGINEFMFHRFAHQANPNVSPGMTMNRWGFHFDRTQTWWENAGAKWFEYMARGSYLLRQGHPVADLMIFVGDGAPNARYKWNDFDPSIPKWLNYDNVNADVLINRVTLADGQIVLPEGGRYPMLALKNCDHVSLATLRRLVEIAESGVLVMGEIPTSLAGYGHSETDYRQFGELADRLAQRLRKYDEWGSQLASLDLRADLFVRENDSLIYEHRRVGETDIFFFTNESQEPASYTVEARVTGKQPERWDAMTGKITPIRRYASLSDGTRARIDLAGHESCFLVFGGGAVYETPVAEDAWDSPRQTPLTADTITAPWRVTFREQGGFAGTLDFPELTDWKDHHDERVNYYSGTATYRTSFDFQPENDLVYHLDLGRVDIVSEVVLNGKNLGVQWMKPFTVDVTDALQSGNNRLVVRVTNLWSNRLIGEERFPRHNGGYELERARNGNGVKLRMPEWYVNNEPLPAGPRTTFTTANFYQLDDELEPSGLAGPVRIIPFKTLLPAPARAPKND